MKIIIKITALLLVTVLILPSLISGCGYRSKYDAVMEYNGIKLTEEFYNYWLSTFKRNILASYSDAEDTEEFWNMKFDDERTIEEYFTEIMNQQIMNYLISQDLYKKNSLKLSSSTKKAISNDIKEKIEFYGGRGSLNSTLSKMMLNIDALEQIYLWEAKHDLVYDYLFGANGPLEISDSDLIKYYEEHYTQIKYVVFYTTDIKTDDKGNYIYDESGNLVSEPLTEEEMIQKQKKITEFKTRLDNGDSFDQLITDYSEYDTSSYPNGFFVSENEIDIWGPDIYKAIKNAKSGEVVKVEEAEAIFYIKICELTPFESLSDADITQLTDLKFTEYAQEVVYKEFYEQLAKNVKINEKVINRYKLSEIKPNPHYSI